MGRFSEGVQTGMIANSGRNPFGVLLESIGKAQLRRYEEDENRKKEERELTRELTILGKDYEYRRALEEDKARLKQEEQENEMLLNSEDITDQVKSGVLGQPSLTLAPQAGTDGGSMDQMANGVLKQAGISRSKNRIIQRDGKYFVVPEDNKKLKEQAQAQKAIQDADPEFQLQQKKNELIIENKNKAKTSETAGILAIAPTMIQSIDKLLQKVQNPRFRWPFAGAARVAFGHPSVVSGDLEEIQSEVNNLKRSAFGEGGKQLTKAERDIVFRPLEPTGKELTTWITELKRAREVIERKAKLVAGTTENVDTNLDIAVNQFLDSIGAE